MAQEREHPQGLVHRLQGLGHVTTSRRQVVSLTVPHSGNRPGRSAGRKGLDIERSGCDVRRVIVLVGLGPIGGGVGAALAEQGEAVLGVDPDAERRAAWAALTGEPVAARPEDISSWAVVDVVVVAVRTADQLWSVLDALPAGERSVLVLTTLGIADARALENSPHAVVEAPVSGGAEGARRGELTMFLHTPEPLAPAAQRVVDGVTSRVLSFDGFGRPAVAKLANNTLAAYIALAVAEMGDVAARAGLDRSTFLDVVSVSSGQSWISDHFDEVAPDLLFKDVALLRRDVGDLPVIDTLDLPAREAEIELARRGARAWSRDDSPVSGRAGPAVPRRQPGGAGRVPAHEG
ncbi:NAD(P)-binding domain-containing protein [Actinomycetospora atypica]|uniref:NAD(P)-binding domain-containing protein n=1 Tax=Actinomycetospora atypica TaxID=1290095 RepID=A0ABV9YPH2_9PSEU